MIINLKYEELEIIINKSNLQLYYLIRNNNKENDFNKLIIEYLGLSPTKEQLNKFMTDYNYMIQEQLKLT